MLATPTILCVTSAMASIVLLAAVAMLVHPFQLMLPWVNLVPSSTSTARVTFYALACVFPCLLLDKIVAVAVLEVLFATLKPSSALLEEQLL